jgi:hypothetical protein
MVFYFIFIFHILGNFAADDDGLFKCDCMPACNELSYDVETSQAKFSWLENLKAEGLNYTTYEKWVSDNELNL